MKQPRLLTAVQTFIRSAIFLMIIIIYPLMAKADVLEVKSISHDPLDLTGAVMSKVDFNGNLCALLKIALPKEASSTIFEGNIIDTQNDGSETHVYMTSGTKYLTIKSTGFEPLKIHFPDYDIPFLEGKHTYEIKVVKKKTLSQVKKSANGTALAYSIIPGLGLIQKGRTGEGVTYLAGDIALLCAGIGFSSNASSQKKIMNDGNTGIDEYNKAKSKYDSSKMASYICFGTAGAVYVVNLIRSYVATPKPNARINWNITPVTTNIYNGLPSPGISFALTYSF